MEDKLSLFEKILVEKKLDGFIVTNETNIFYLSHFKGILENNREALLIFSPHPTLIVSRMYQNEAQKLNSRNLKVKIISQDKEIIPTIQNLLKKPKRVGFEEADLKYLEFKKFAKALQKTKLVPTKKLIENLRAQKSQDEIAKIQKGQNISLLSFEKLLKILKIGQAEEEIAETLAKIIKSFGASLAFKSIVASGTNSGSPHHKTSLKKIKKGEILLLDFGAKYKEYCSDLSRTIFLGKAKDRDRNIYDHVLNAQKKAIEKIRENSKGSEIFNLVNNYFKEQKLKDHFLHNLGHGIGLEIHEGPHLAPAKNDLLAENMVFSIEPGLYFPWGGIRIEDLVSVKNGKGKILGKHLPKFIEIG